MTVVIGLAEQMCLQVTSCLNYVCKIEVNIF